MANRTNLYFQIYWHRMGAHPMRLSCPRPIMLPWASAPAPTLARRMLDLSYRLVRRDQRPI